MKHLGRKIEKGTERIKSVTDILESLKVKMCISDNMTDIHCW